jgi:hypothetical protein
VVFYLFYAVVARVFSAFSQPLPKLDFSYKTAICFKTHTESEALGKSAEVIGLQVPE